MKVKELVQTCKGIKKVVVHTRNGFEFLGEWEESQFKYFDLWEKSTWLVKKGVLNTWDDDECTAYYINYELEFEDDNIWKIKFE